MRRLTDADWTVFRKLYKVALERFSQRTVLDVQRLAAHPDKSFHERYRAINKLIERRNVAYGAAFKPLKRPLAFINLLAVYNMGILTPEELAEFSPEMRETLQAMLGTRLIPMGHRLELLDDFEDD
jgi:hypothetical protein